MPEFLGHRALPADRGLALAAHFRQCFHTHHGKGKPLARAVVQIDRNAAQEAFVERRRAFCGAGHALVKIFVLRQQDRELGNLLLQLLLLGGDGLARAPDQGGKQQVHGRRCRDYHRPAFQPSRADGLRQDIGRLIDLRDRQDRPGFRVVYRREDFDEL